MKKLVVVLFILLCGVGFGQIICDHQLNPDLVKFRQPDIPLELDATIRTIAGIYEPCALWFYRGEYSSARLFGFYSLGTHADNNGYREHEVVSRSILDYVIPTFGQTERLNVYMWVPNSELAAWGYMVVDGYNQEGLYFLALYPISAQ